MPGTWSKVHKVITAFPPSAYHKTVAVLQPQDILTVNYRLLVTALSRERFASIATGTVATTVFTFMFANVTCFMCTSWRNWICRGKLDTVLKTTSKVRNVLTKQYLLVYPLNFISLLLIENSYMMFQSFPQPRSLRYHVTHRLYGVTWRVDLYAILQAGDDLSVLQLQSKCSNMWAEQRYSRRIPSSLCRHSTRIRVFLRTQTDRIDHDKVSSMGSTNCFCTNLFWYVRCLCFVYEQTSAFMANDISMYFLMGITNFYNKLCTTVKNLINDKMHMIFEKQ